MADIVALRRGEKITDDFGAPTRRFIEYIEATTGQINSSTSIIETLATISSLPGHIGTTDPHEQYYLANGSKDIDGPLTHTGSTLGFYGVTVTTRPAAYTQTYSATSRTHNNLLMESLTDNTGGSIDTTIAVISGTGDDSTLNDNFADLTKQINQIRVDLINIKSVLNQVIDDDQLNGLKQ